MIEDKIQNILDNTEKGLDFGLSKMNIHFGGMQREAIYAVGAAPKVGKTTFVDYCFLLSPYLKNVLEEKRNIHWIYFSFEISRIRKMFKLAPFFFYRDYNKDTFVHKEKVYSINSNYLMNKQLDDDEELIKILPEDKEIFEEIYEKRLIPLFGEIKNGVQVKKGVVDIIERAENPTGLRNYIFEYAKNHGKFGVEKYQTSDDSGRTITKNKIVDYTPNNKDDYVIIITDHIRKLRPERGFNQKQIIDKYLTYQVEMRNLFGYTFVDIVHLNRNLDAIDRMKYSKDRLFPGLGDFKDSGNVGEDSDYVITGFDPRDEKYMLTKHFGHNLIDYPNYRSWHVVASRDTPTFNIYTEMNGNKNLFKEI